MGKTNELHEFAGFGASLFDAGSGGAGTFTPDLANGTFQKFVCTAATRTIGAPTIGGGAVGGNVPTGTRLVLWIGNTSGGALTLTWNAVFKTPSGTGPATANYRMYELVWDGAVWRTLSVSADQAT